jgi:hypothetical protein
MLRLATRAPGTMTIARDQDAVHVTILFAAGAPDGDAAPAAPSAGERLPDLDGAGAVTSAPACSGSGS